ncbi:hypothetical protein [Micromonospora chersina]|uniref:hypothetical protein n=1 Tax=Micromonospora chersina TaxID=47854 RepID=UPI001B11EC1C|nr:hypothetical protein Nm8I071_21680 [Nonomuraea sp. TT08I-71]
MTVVMWVVPAVVGVGVAVVAGWRWRVRTRREPTRAEQLAAARKATRDLRRSGPRAHRDTFERGGDPVDRHSAAILENSVYGDAAGHGDGGGGDGGGSY